jgi:folate-dependent tRNA-U54 methylase TrmFO/GidA
MSKKKVHIVMIDGIVVDTAWSKPKFAKKRKKALNKYMNEKKAARVETLIIDAKDPALKVYDE